MADPAELQRLMDQWNKLPSLQEQGQHEAAKQAAYPRPLGMLEGGARQVLQGIPGVGAWTDEVAGNIGGNLGQIQSENNAFTQNHPIATAAARTVGGLGSMVGLMAAPEAALGPVAGLRAAAIGERGLGPLLATGTAAGAVEGAGMADGDFANRMKGMAIGGGAGLATSAAAPIVGGAIRGGADSIGRAFARIQANRGLPGASVVGDRTGKLPKPNFDKAPDTMIGDLSPKATGLAGEIATRGDPAADKVVNAYQGRETKNKPIGSNPAPPSPAQEGYSATNQAITDAVANYTPQARPSVVGTAGKALSGALGMYGGLEAIMAAVGQPNIGHLAGAAAGIGKIIKAVADRPKPIISEGMKLGEKDAGKAADVLSMTGKTVLDNSGKKPVFVNPEITDAVDKINQYLIARRAAGDFANKAKGVGIGLTMGAGGALEPQGNDARKAATPGAKAVYDSIRGRKN